jgi:hypothetical protein
MDDRQLLELAAKAAGYDVAWNEHWAAFQHRNPAPDAHGVMRHPWTPLTDDGDALRLAVKLGLCVEVDLCDDATRVSETECELIAKHMHFDGGPEAATRRAIVRAAAEIAGDA